VLLRYKNILKEEMDWKSTAMVNATTLIGLSMVDISEAVKIGAMIVGMAWTIIQIVNGVNQFTDRKDRLNRIRKERKKRKKDDKKL
jgi:hypothetical protein